MDGVLVNFHKHACPLFGIAYPKNSVLGWNWLFERAGVGIDEFLSRVDSTAGFWEGLDAFPWTSDLMQVLDVVNPDWGIMTAGTHDPRSWAGKAAWVSRHLQASGLYRLVVMHGQKGKIGGCGDVLIDDSYDQCVAWNHAGGKAFHWVEYSEDLSGPAMEQVGRLKMLITQWSGSEGG